MAQLGREVVQEAVSEAVDRGPDDAERVELRAADADHEVGAGLEERQERGDAGAGVGVIRIDEDRVPHPVRSGPFESLPRRPALPLRGLDEHGRSVLVRDLDGPVGRVAVDDEERRREAGGHEVLERNVVERSGEPFLFVQRRQDDGDGHGAGVGSGWLVGLGHREVG